MPESGGLAVAILAAGQSRRFGAKDKLAVILNGRMLGLHASEALHGVAASRRWVIASAPDHQCCGGWREAGFEIAVNFDAAQGLGTSTAMAATLADDAGSSALLIALADMPFVTFEHFQALAAMVAPNALVASHNGLAPTPPALFGREHFSQLMQYTGDRGAGGLLKRAEIITCPPDHLRDVDVPGDLH